MRHGREKNVQTTCTAPTASMAGPFPTLFNLLRRHGQHHRPTTTTLYTIKPS